MATTEALQYDLVAAGQQLQGAEEMQEVRRLAIGGSEPSEEASRSRLVLTRVLLSL